MELARGAHTGSGPRLCGQSGTGRPAPAWRGPVVDVEQEGGALEGSVG